MPGVQGLDKVTDKLNKYIKEKTSAAKKVLLIEGEKSIQKNFEVGGRPNPWKKSKKSRKNKGTKTLVISGALKNVRGMETEQGVKFTVDPRAKDYARIQNDGGVINRAGGKLKMENRKGKKKLFVSMKRKTKYKEKTYKPYQIRIPARPFMVIPKEDHGQIVEAVKKVFK